VVWGIALHVLFVRNVSIIAIRITLLGVLSLLERGVIVVVGGVVARTVAIFARRGVPGLKYLSCDLILSAPLS
jgi:hypothetical protein